MGVSRGDFNPPHRVAGPSAAPPHAAAYLAAQPDPKPHPRPVKPEGDGGYARYVSFYLFPYAQLDTDVVFCLFTGIRSSRR